MLHVDGASVVVPYALALPSMPMPLVAAWSLPQWWLPMVLPMSLPCHTSVPALSAIAIVIMHPHCTLPLPAFTIANDISHLYLVTFGLCIRITP
jgi:hypothetical protein